jgi:hypothetical protein
LSHSRLEEFITRRRRERREYHQVFLEAKTAIAAVAGVYGLMYGLLDLLHDFNS